MKLTKDQALGLLAALSHYQIVCEMTRVSCVQSLSADLVTQLRAFVLDEPKLGLDPVPDGIVLARDERDADSATESYVLGSELHALSAIQATAIGSSWVQPDEEVTLEFEFTSGPGVNVTDLLVNGRAIDDVTYIRRTEENELLVAERYDGNLVWHRFHVQSYPKGWTELLPVEDLIEIE